MFWHLLALWLLEKLVYKLDKIFNVPCFQIPTKYYLCPEGSGSLDGKTKFTQRKQLPFTLVNTSLYTLHLTLNLNFFPLCFWFSHTAACGHFLRILWKGTAVTSMLSLKAFFHSFRSTGGSEYPLHRHPLKGVFTTFSHLLLWVSLLLFFFWPKSCSVPVFLFFPDPAYIYIIHALGSKSLYYNFCHFYHSQWLHLLLLPGVLLSFNFDTCLHYPGEKNSRGLERTAGNGLYTFPEVVTIGWCKFTEERIVRSWMSTAVRHSWYSVRRRKPVRGEVELTLGT